MSKRPISTTHAGKLLVARVASRLHTELSCMRHTHPCIRPSIHASIHPPIHPPTHPPAHPYTHPSIHPPLFRWADGLLHQLVTRHLPDCPKLPAWLHPAVGTPGAASYALLLYSRPYPLPPPPRPPQTDASYRSIATALLEHVASGVIKPTVQKVLPLQDAAQVGDERAASQPARGSPGRCLAWPA